MSFAITPIVVALLAAFDGDGRPTTSVDGHKLRAEKVSTSQFNKNERPVKNVSITFAVEPKDAAKSFAYELGQRFVARDAAGKEIPLGRVRSSMRSEPEFRLAGYPTSIKSDRLTHFRDSMTVTIPLLKADVTSLATLEGDLFVSDVELLEFTFDKNELNPNTVKKSKEAEAKLFLFDEGQRGVDIGFKLSLPIRSRPEALTGGHGGIGSEQCLLYATEAGRKSRLATSGFSASGGRSGSEDDARVRSEREFHRVELNGKLDALHLVIPQIESPRRFPFQLKDVPVPAPPERPAPPVKGIALK